MSASRCLGPFVKTIMRLPMKEWRSGIEQLPTVCPHADCNAPLNCKKRCRDFAVAQWHLRVAQVKLKDAA